MSSEVEETDDPCHYFAYEFVRRIYHHIENDTQFYRVRKAPSTPRLFTEEHWQRIRGILNVLVLPLTVSLNFCREEVNITQESYRNSIGVVIDMYKRNEYCEDQFFIMCTSIAIWAFLAKRRGLPDAAKEAVDLIRNVTTEVLRNGSFENSFW